MLEWAISIAALGTSLGLQGGTTQPYLCTARISENHFIHSIIESSLPEASLDEQWQSAVKSKTGRDDRSVNCRRDTKEEAERYIAGFASNFPDTRYEKVDFNPSGQGGPDLHREVRTVSFNPPRSHENGFAHATFDIEYRFISCGGELHLAYSLRDDSAKLRRDVYGIKGERAAVSARPGPLTAVDISVKVWDGTHDVAEFRDRAAGPALGLGCFTGQTQKIGLVKALVGDKPTTDQVHKFTEGLKVDIVSNETLRSAAAEQEMRGLPKRELGGGRPDQTSNDQQASEAADRRAARDAEFQMKMEAYEEGLAANKAAVEKYNADLAAVEAQKAVNAERAKAIQEDYARRQAAHAAEVDRIRQLNAANQVGTSSTD